MRVGPALPSKIYHYAAKINAEGGVSALCFVTPRAIDLSRASWTIRENAVTCRKCKRAIANRTMIGSLESQAQREPSLNQATEQP